MGQEVSTAVFLGVALVMIAAVVVAGFQIFQVAKSIMNNGVTQLQDALAVVEASQYSDYDQTVIAGIQVQSAIKNFQGKNCAILVANASTNYAISGTTLYANNLKAVKAAGAKVASAHGAVGIVLYNSNFSLQQGKIGQKPGSGLNFYNPSATMANPKAPMGSAGDATATIPGLDFSKVTSQTTASQVFVTSALDSNTNYNGTFLPVNDGSASADEKAFLDIAQMLGNQDTYLYFNYNTELDTRGNHLWRDGGYYKFSASYSMDKATNSPIVNKNVTNCWTSGTCEYISGSAKYSANLLRDNTDTTIGIVFTQIKN